MRRAKLPMWAPACRGPHSEPIHLAVAYTETGTQPPSAAGGEINCKSGLGTKTGIL